MLSAPAGTELLVLRHAEVYNPKDIVYGRLPRFGLSAAGRTQAELAARFLACRPLQAIYSSPLLRARQTAQIVAMYHAGIRLRRSAALLEVKTGYEGSPNSILKAGFSFYDPLKSPSDESMEQVWRRILTLIGRVSRRHPGKTVLLVSHGDPITIMRLGIEGSEFTVPNLHRTVYAARASVMQVQLFPAESPRIAYFDVQGEGP